MKRIQLFFLAFCLVAVSNGQEKKYILNEEFNSNTLGWVEEFTDAHVTEIKDGFLFIHSIDTSKYQSSNAPQKTSFLLGLPKSFQIESTFILIDTTSSMNFGILLNSPSLNYRFYLSDSSIGGVSEYDANRNSEIIIIENSKNKVLLKVGERIDFKIKVMERDFEFYINGKLYANGILNARSWWDLRLFTTSGSAIKVDHIKIH